MEIHEAQPILLEENETLSILQGEVRTFPGIVSTTEYFKNVVSDTVEIKSKVALIVEEKRITFEQLDSSSSKIALILRDIIEEKKLKNENPDGDWVIALCLPPTEKLIFCIFAIHKLGAAYVPIDVTFPQNRVANIVTNCKPVIFISDSAASTLSKFDIVKSQTEVMTFDDLWTKAVKLEVANVVLLPSDQEEVVNRVAIVLYTSGSSGTPKGVRLKHSAIMNRLFWQWDTFPFTATEKCCFKTSLTFVDSVAEIFGPLLRGYAIHIFSKLTVSNPNLLIKAIHATGITRLVLVPSLLRALLATLQLSDDINEKQKLNSIRLWVCSGETLQKDLLDEFFLQFPTGDTMLANFYGSTEIMADVTFVTFSSAAEVEQQVVGNHVPIGSPVFNTILYVLNEELGVVTLEDIGELYVAGYNLSSGYVGIANVDKFIPNPFSNTNGCTTLFKTGDFVRIVKKGKRLTLLYEGRSDSQVKVRGQRVDLNEIEAVLNSQSDLIDRAFVLCCHPGKEDQAIVAFVIPTTREVKTESIVARAKENLKPYEIPEVKKISEVPLLVNGKVDRQRLLSSFENERNAVGSEKEILTFPNLSNEFVPQAIALVRAISEVTRVTEENLVENLNDSFFNLGGTSLNSITVVTKLRTQGFYIGLDDFVRAGTLRVIIFKITPIQSSTTPGRSIGWDDEDYFAQFLSSSDVEETSGIIAHSFSRKGDLEVYTNASYQDFKEFITKLFPVLLEKNLSFIVRRKSDKSAVATALNFDLADEPDDVVAAPGIKTVLNFLEWLESRQRDKLPKGTNKIVHSFMMGTHESVTVAENVSLVTFMEKEITRIAKDRGFTGVMTTNTNPLTMQVCSDILGYETLTEYQVNQYEAEDGSRPFKLAPDSQIVNCCWKQLQIQDVSSISTVNEVNN